MVILACKYWLKNLAKMSNWKFKKCQINSPEEKHHQAGKGLNIADHSKTHGLGQFFGDFFVI
uniref:Uncharacterized protein n=1 Tax=Romanomermis culicivorax TaxID=13658 RepID=A0A915IWD5_ROMCU